MEVRNCAECGKMFNYIGGPPLCSMCIKELEEKFQTVKEYIYDNPRASINEVAEENKVSIRQIKRWVREERLAFSEDSPTGIECKSCGKSIKTGCYCDKCKRALEQQLGNVYKQPDVEVQKTKHNSEAKMRFLK